MISKEIMGIPFCVLFLLSLERVMALLGEKREARAACFHRVLVLLFRNISAKAVYDSQEELKKSATLRVQVFCGSLSDYRNSKGILAFAYLSVL